MRRVVKWQGFLAKGRQILPILLSHLILGWFYPKSDANNPSSSWQFPATDTLAGLSVVLNICQGFPGPEYHGGFLQVAATEDLLKIPTGGDWNFHIGLICSLEAMILYHRFPFKEPPCAQACACGHSIPDSILSKPLLPALYLRQSLRPVDDTWSSTVRMEVSSYRCWHQTVAHKAWKQRCQPRVAELPRLLLSYFIITTAYNQKCFTLQDFLARILMSSLSFAQRWGFSTRRINVRAEKKRSATLLL